MKPAFCDMDFIVFDLINKPVFTIYSSGPKTNITSLGQNKASVDLTTDSEPFVNF